ncbi:geminin coiled-coil domain-containing protein 1-like isoform X1 [Acipenser oxyrinchus oxyrinchus]|uniref:Geminin coiled-coil domain-containing protein 1-like isoform X1 n=1 Tax=Acipenser oxyrinchus oxyrinchus TaxID=40147 RepID=A0AAD8DGT5_ACIOX|nr:geminin coiled-coil domain-containing protein 1-like isoform X1 [Acipenser oxyrinchus oxyrinchus]
MAHSILALQHPSEQNPSASAHRRVEQHTTIGQSSTCSPGWNEGLPSICRCDLCSTPGNPHCLPTGLYGRFGYLFYRLQVCYLSRHKADSLTPNQIAGREESPKASQRVELGSCSPPQTAQPYLKVRGAFILKSLFIPPCKMSAILSCQDQYFVGGQGYDCPYSVSTSAANVDVSKETLVSFWAAGLLDNRAYQHEPQSQQLYYELDSGIREDFIWTDDLSPQLQRNQQLQDTLLQKEEELARLHDENNKLKEYLNSTFVKGLEEKAKILLHNGPGVDSRPRNKRRRVLGDEGVHASTASQLLPGSSLKKACRNLSLEFCTAEELAHTPPVDSWVLQTLGLKDVDTIDHSANYSDLLTSLDDHNALHAAGAMDYNNVGHVSSPLGYCPDTGVGVEYTGSPCSLDSCYLPPLPSSSPQAQSTPLPSSATPSPFKSPYSVDVSRNKTEVAFTMSLNPHRNVKTHSFDQGQAFVCRDEQAGWKFTWVPKQSE